MTNFWNTKGIPHKGWTLEDVYDVREDGQPEWDTTYETCMMCNNERIRYVHVLSHPEVSEQFKVGCTCAERMTEDYVNPKEREKELKKRSQKRISWLKKKWKVSKQGNYYLTLDGYVLVIMKVGETGKFKSYINKMDKKRGGKKLYNSVEEAKGEIFKVIEILKERGDW